MLSFVLPSFKTVTVIISIVVIALSIDKASSLLNRIIEGTPSIEGKMSRTIPLFRKVPQAKLGVSGKYHSIAITVIAMLLYNTQSQIHPGLEIQVMNQRIPNGQMPIG